MANTTNMAPAHPNDEDGIPPPPLEILAQDPARIHRSWIPSYGHVQKCDCCNARAPGGILQICNDCSLRLCRGCIEKRSWYRNRDHFVDSAKCDWRKQKAAMYRNGGRRKTATERRRYKAQRRRRMEDENDDDEEEESNAPTQRPLPPAPPPLSNQPTENDARAIAAGALLSIREECTRPSVSSAVPAPVPGPFGCRLAEEEVERSSLISDIYYWTYGDRPHLDPRRPRTQIPVTASEPSGYHGPRDAASLTEAPGRPTDGETSSNDGSNNPAPYRSNLGTHHPVPGAPRANPYDHGYNGLPTAHQQNSHQLDLQVLSDMRRAWDNNPILVQMRQYISSGLRALDLLWGVFDAHRERLGRSFPQGLDLETVRWFVRERDHHMAFESRAGPAFSGYHSIHTSHTDLPRHDPHYRLLPSALPPHYGLYPHYDAHGHGQPHHQHYGSVQQAAERLHQVTSVGLAPASTATAPQTPASAHGSGPSPAVTRTPTPLQGVQSDEQTSKVGTPGTPATSTAATETPGVHHPNTAFDGHHAVVVADGKQKETAIVID